MRYGLEASLSESMCEEIVLSEECCKSIVEYKDGNIKALAVALPSLFINTKVFPFPILNLCQYQLNIVRFLDHLHRLLTYHVALILLCCLLMFLCGY